MKKKFALVTATAVTALLLFVGCGVKVTNISVPDAATIEKGESITLPVNFGTEDAPAAPSSRRLAVFTHKKGKKILQASIPPTCKISRSIPFNPH